MTFKHAKSHRTDDLFNANLGIYMTQAPILKTPKGKIEDALRRTILSRFEVFRPLVVPSSSTRACSLTFCQSIKSHEICLIDMKIQDISCCRAIGLARNEH